uniref:Uncharacterized protein n=1 Tax=Anguilla anguilla TaxID=7936 RepID=A0A0E9RS24_ANGAN
MRSFFCLSIEYEIQNSFVNLAINPTKACQPVVSPSNIPLTRNQ